MLKFLAPTPDHQTKMAQGQLLESTQSFEIFAHGSKDLLVNENRWDVEKISSRLDNGISNVHGCHSNTQRMTFVNFWMVFSWFHNIYIEVINISRQRKFQMHLFKLERRPVIIDYLGKPKYSELLPLIWNICLQHRPSDLQKAFYY